MLGTYVDDNYVLGNKDAMKEIEEGVKQQGMSVTVENSLDDYLSCNIIFSQDKKRAWIGQPHLIKKMEKKFGKLVEQLTDTKTAGTPNTQVIQPKEKIEAVDEETQSMYRSGVGMLLYLVKHSRPDIANPTRELSKSMLMASEANWKELL